MKEETKKKMQKGLYYVLIAFFGFSGVMTFASVFQKDYVSLIQYVAMTLVLAWYIKIAGRKVE